MFQPRIFLLLLAFTCIKGVPFNGQVNLDLPPEQRWVVICQQHKERFQNLVLFAERAIVPKPYSDLVEMISKDLDVYFPKDMILEMKGISKTLDIDLGVFVFFNVLYDFTAFHRLAPVNYFHGCTSIVAQDSKGVIWHARNLDYGSDTTSLTGILRNMTLQVEYVQKGKVLFTSTTYAGMVGVFTAQKHNQFTLSIDERDKGDLFENIYVFLTKPFTFTSVLARQIMEQASNFTEAVQMASVAITPATSYYILAGTKPGEGAVVTRDRLGVADVWPLNAANGTWFLVETNYDHWKSTPSSDPRRQTAMSAMNKLGRNNVSSSALFKVLSIPPVLNSATTFTTIMSASQPEVYSTTVRYDTDTDALV